MNVLLVDFLTCPRCGPDFGLILLAQEAADRRVTRGRLGCPNCRDQFPIESGVADLRPPPREAFPDDLPGAERAVEGLELAACLGVPEGPGFFVFVGLGTTVATAVAERVRDIEVVAVERAPQAPAGADRVSPIAAGPRLPLRAGARGGAVAAADWDGWHREVVRVAQPGARVVRVGGEPDESETATPSGTTPVFRNERFAVFLKG